MNEKLCAFCANVKWEDSRGYGSTATGPYGAAGLTCSKGHFNQYEFEHISSAEEYRSKILRAESCPDYKAAA